MHNVCIILNIIRKIFYVTEARCASWSGRKSLASKTSCIVRRLDESLAQLGQRALSIPPAWHRHRTQIPMASHGVGTQQALAQLSKVCSKSAILIWIDRHTQVIHWLVQSNHEERHVKWCEIHELMLCWLHIRIAVLKFLECMDLEILRALEPNGICWGRHQRPPDRQALQTILTHQWGQQWRGSLDQSRTRQMREALNINGVPWNKDK